jgi:putative aminopeptidase FrvX
MDKQALTDKIKARVVDNRISCAQALAIAEEEKVPSKAVGELLNEMGIKVTSCQLGCFP